MEVLDPILAQTSITEWWEIAEKLGLGATFVLGVAVLAIWREWNAERNYSRTRDRETLEVLNKLTQVHSEQTNAERTGIESVLRGISELKSLIERHVQGR